MDEEKADGAQGRLDEIERRHQARIEDLLAREKRLTEALEARETYYRRRLNEMESKRLADASRSIAEETALEFMRRLREDLRRDLERWQAALDRHEKELELLLARRTERAEGAEPPPGPAPWPSVTFQEPRSGSDAQAHGGGRRAGLLLTGALAAAAAAWLAVRWYAAPLSGPHPHAVEEAP